MLKNTLLGPALRALYNDQSARPFVHPSVHSSVQLSFGPSVRLTVGDILTWAFLLSCWPNLAHILSTECILVKDVQ